MEISCVICSDLFSQNSDIVLNQCGHTFHHTCLIQWLERSKSCPQCRCRSTEKSIYRVYFNFVNTDNIKDDVGTLQFKLDNAKFKILTLEKKLREQTEIADSKEAQNIQLKDLVSTLEKKLRSCDSVINGLKDKMGIYKNKASEVDRLQSELTSVKTALDSLEKVQSAVIGTRDEVKEILRNETSIEVLATLSASLKKSLLLEQRNTSSLRKQLQHSQNELMKYKKDNNSLELSNSDLRKLYESRKESWEEEKKYLKQKIEELSNLLDEQKSVTPQKFNNSVQRILTESPAPLPRRRIDLLKTDHCAPKSSPSVAESVLQIKNSESPYLNTRTNYSSIFNARYSSVPSQKKYIFKTQKATTSSNPSPPTNDMVYTGLGGQVREDYFKFPEKKSPSGVKRTKSSSAIPSSKFRKLAPVGVRKITEFTK